MVFLEVSRVYGRFWRCLVVRFENFRERSRGVSQKYVENFCLPGKKFVRLPFWSFWYQRSMRNWGITIFHQKLFLSDRTDICRRGSFLCFRASLVSENLVNKRGFHDSSSRFFCFTVLKNFVERIFVFVSTCLCLA